VFLLVVLVAAFGRSALATPSGFLELSGSRSASIDITLRSPLDLVFLGTTQGLVVGTRGTYGGLLVEDAHGDVLGGAVSVPQLTGSGPRGAPMFFTPPTYETELHLSPGRYRFTLLADGPSVVWVPMRGRALPPLRPKRAVRTRAALVDVVTGGPVPLSTAQVPLGDFGPGTSALLAIDHLYNPGVASAEVICLVHQGEPCLGAPNGAGGSAARLQVPTPYPGPAGSQSWLFVNKGVITGDDITASFTLAGDGVPVNRKAFVVAIG